MGTLRYCEHSGSSRGAREFLQASLPSFVEKNPQLAFDPKLRPGKHPFVEATYVNGRSKQIGLKNESADSVAEIVQALRDQSGKKLIKSLSTQCYQDLRARKVIGIQGNLMASRIFGESWFVMCM